MLPAALPTLDVNEGALDTIFSIYKQLLPEMGGYLIHDGRLQHQRLEILLAKLAELEQETLEQRACFCKFLLQLLIYWPNAASYLSIQNWASKAMLFVL